jgi:cell wall-associated NlpC family hydrolase
MIRRMPIAAVLLLFMVSCVPGGYRYGGQAREKVVRTAQKYIGVRYKHGGATPGGFDCSGYVMYVYERNGILLPRSVKRQYQAGKKIRLGQAKPGDLVFFRTSRKRRLSHVGIYLGDRRFIHSPRTGKKVSYADMSKPYWRKRYIGSVTFLGKRVGPGISRASGG